MNIGKLRRGLNRVSKAAIHGRENDFIRATCGAYLSRYLNKGYPMDEETLVFLAWIMEGRMKEVADLLVRALPEKDRAGFAERLAEAQGDPEELPEVLDGMVRKTRVGRLRTARRQLVEMLELQAGALAAERTSKIEENLRLLAEAFSFNRTELKLATLLFIVKAYDEADTYLIDHLKCDRFRSRNLLRSILGVGHPDLTAALGRFDRIDVIDRDKDQVELTDWFLSFCQTPGCESFTARFYRRIPRRSLPLSCHAIDRDRIRLMLKLLEKKSEVPRHILLYGPPGTGKTSFAYAAASNIQAPAYEIACEDENESSARRAALMSCLKMTNSGSGSIIIVDEADNLLNTKNSWFMRGETQDKGWLNRVMEEPGTRVIWITNSIGMIEDSVLRRFAFSLEFKPFNRRQRVQLWKSILKRNRATGMLDPDRVDALARRYKVSAGVIDAAVKTARAAAGSERREFERAVAMALEAYHALKNPDGSTGAEIVAENYSLDGLNIEGDIAKLIDQLDRFEQVLRSNSDKRVNLNLLFFGPPGTGKSALARYLADRIDREVVCKRLSDLQSKWVGEGEKNIRRAFEEAENEEAVLVIDEADSVLFNRDRARHSWEISFTNEVLTCMEHFRGILICTTNCMTDLDPASIRRFNRKIRFDYLTPQGVLTFYEKLLRGLVGSLLAEEEAAALQRMTNLTPGDFRMVRDRFALQPAGTLNHRMLVEAMAEESRLKATQTNKRMIGF